MQVVVALNTKRGSSVCFSAIWQYRTVSKTSISSF